MQVDSGRINNVMTCGGQATISMVAAVTRIRFVQRTLAGAAA